MLELLYLETVLSKTAQESIDLLDNGSEDAIAKIADEDDEVDPQQAHPYEQVKSMLGEDVILPSVGDANEVYWPDDNQFYPGTVTRFEPSSGKTHVSYDDRDKEKLIIQEETWLYPSEQNVVPNGVELAPGMVLSSVEQEIIVIIIACSVRRSFCFTIRRVCRLLSPKMRTPRKKSRFLKLCESSYFPCSCRDQCNFKSCFVQSQNTRQWI